jgi:hypothetical protein
MLADPADALLPRHFASARGRGRRSQRGGGARRAAVLAAPLALAEPGRGGPRLPQFSEWALESGRICLGSTDEAGSPGTTVGSGERP